jgi:hypothetical protein
VDEKIAKFRGSIATKNRLERVGQLRLNAWELYEGKSMRRSRLLYVAAAAVGLFAASVTASAQAYLTRPIQVIVPFAAAAPATW